MTEFENHKQDIFTDIHGNELKEEHIKQIHAMVENNKITVDYAQIVSIYKQFLANRESIIEHLEKLDAIIEELESGTYITEVSLEETVDEKTFNVTKQIKHTSAKLENEIAKVSGV